ncbi:hypothetical protein OPV22_028971 [Ensete ventricosum]|uniref:Uncharacterized protein n=1 Tax=Ensete ventricosum TaxID=4639 RepID=A0AAV8QC50_ENSVE|nr:hypothetical protein OPV22_028971 [Ensete ventricosum]RZS16752.1 hypothetical protein BHM03_00048789 [Ensete ventricosum]
MEFHQQSFVPFTSGVSPTVSSKQQQDVPAEPGSSSSVTGAKKKEGTQQSSCPDPTKQEADCETCGHGGINLPQHRGNLNFYPPVAAPQQQPPIKGQRQRRAMFPQPTNLALSTARLFTTCDQYLTAKNLADAARTLDDRKDSVPSPTIVIFSTQQLHIISLSLSPTIYGLGWEVYASKPHPTPMEATSTFPITWEFAPK